MASFRCAPARDLPIKDGVAYDGPAASQRMLDASGIGAGSSGNPDVARARRGFLIYDAARPELRGSYHLPFADIVGGTLTAIGNGLRNAASRLPQMQGVPDAVRAEARRILDAYMARLNEAKSTDAESETASRTVADFEYKFSTNEPDGTFEGYGSVFNVEDANGDLILPHAFDETLAASRRTGSLPKMLLNHGMGGMGMQINAEDMLPIGKWTKMSADSHGLQVKGRLINLDTESGKRIYGAMKEGELSGLSIGYIARDFTRGSAPNEPRRTLKNVEVFEVSPVTFPANAAAGVSQVKALGPIATIRQFEAALRERLGFSRLEAAAVASGGFKALQRDADGPNETVAALRRLAATMRPA